MYLTAFNAIVTSIAICCFAVSDQDLNIDDPRSKSLIQFFLPQIYKETRDSQLLTLPKFLGWMLYSLL
jgi:PhoPQ-activated pathogenicity-related protein